MPSILKFTYEIIFVGIILPFAISRYIKKCMEHFLNERVQIMISEVLWNFDTSESFILYFFALGLKLNF